MRGNAVEIIVRGVTADGIGNFTDKKRYLVKPLNTLNDGSFINCKREVGGGGGVDDKNNILYEACNENFDPIHEE